MIDALERSGRAATKARAELEIANQSFRRVRPGATGSVSWPHRALR